ncbi:MAG: hypothetical protein LC624_04470 [Halobacteriales archaeon]|nr:hypothetical protein [Halobacteriales archaeon]
MAIQVTFDNTYEVPPDYAAKWLTDFRSDDPQRFFGRAEGHRVVERKGDQFRIEGTIPGFADAKGMAVIDSATSWHADNDFFKGGKLVAKGGVRESVRAEGKGTLHHVEVWSEPLAFSMKIMMPLMGAAMMKKSLTAGFAEIKKQIEADYRAGKPPTS